MCNKEHAMTYIARNEYRINLRVFSLNKKNNLLKEVKGSGISLISQRHLLRSGRWFLVPGYP